MRKCAHMGAYAGSFNFTLAISAAAQNEAARERNRSRTKDRPCASVQISHGLSPEGEADDGPSQTLSTRNTRVLVIEPNARTNLRTVTNYPTDKCLRVSIDMRSVK